MTVRRIVSNIAVGDTTAAKQFYGDVLGLDLLMDHGWVVTYGNAEMTAAQISFATEGGSGTDVPDISIEVDDIDTVLAGMLAAGFAPVYGPADEPWGVRRFYVRDPYGRLVNILAHRQDQHR
jgi:catechol 2,3-dioxygenase-like lactoylglutathione lyase family enzyme